MNYIGLLPFKNKNDEEYNKDKPIFVVNMDYIIRFNYLPKKMQYTALTAIRQYMNPFHGPTKIHNVHIEQHKLNMALHILCNTNHTVDMNHHIKQFVRDIFKKIDINRKTNRAILLYACLLLPDFFST